MTIVVLAVFAVLAAVSCAVTWLQGRGALANVPPPRLWNWLAIWVSTMTGVLFVLFLSA